MNNIIQTIQHSARAATVLLTVRRAATVLLMMLLTTTMAWAGDVTVTSSTTTWTSGNTYNVTSDVTISASISVSGSVTLNLGAGTTLTLNQGIDVSTGNWLTITGDGTLIVHGPNGTDGLNGAYGGDGDTGVNGNLIINSGSVTITGGNGGDSLSEIGNEGLGGSGGAGVKGDLIVNGGTVTVNGSDGGVGIMPGPGGNGIDGCLTLNGGTVTINSGRNLEGWFMGITGDITLAGGTLVFPNIDSRDSYAFDYDRNVMIDGYIYKYIYENSVGYLTGSLNDDQKNDLYDKPLTLLPEFAGEGTEASPYLITSYNDLLNLRNDVNGGEAYDGKYFKQTADIDWPANTTWTNGIGIDASHRFGGHYNGDGNAIRHLTINGTSTNTGLFGYVRGAEDGRGGYYSTTLKNIVLEDCDIDASSVSNSYAAGILAVTNFDNTVENCRVSGTIKGDKAAGGIIGCEDQGNVKNCFADVTVTASVQTGYNSSGQFQYCTVGKIIGYVVNFGSATVTGNYYHADGATDGTGNVVTAIGRTNSSTYSDGSRAAPLYTVSSTNLTAAATNATVTHAGTHYFASGATVTLTTDGNHIISGTPTVSGAGASLGSVASDRKSMTVTVGTQDVTVSATLGTICGSCGDNATWSLTQDGNGNYTRLTISGTGAMQDYDHDNNSVWRTTAPWGYGITSVTIGDGITTIGKFAFCGCQQLSSVTIGNSVTTIGDASINHCDALTELTLPASVASIGNGAFHNDVGLTRLNIQRTDGLVTLAENTIFNNCNALQAIVVPTLALAVQYQSATYWSTHAAKLRAPFGSQLFAVTTEGGTAAYVIANATDWNNLATAVNGGANGSGQTFRQTANITVSNFTPIGSSEANSFRGTYDGGSKTLTATCNAVSSNYVAPFGYLYGTAEAHASVKDLSVVTTITAAGYKHIAGLIAVHSGYVDVTNCNANVSISSTVGTQNPTDLYPAALVSQTGSGGTLTVTGCTATGTISTNGKYAGGLVGIVQGAASISDCVSSVTIDSSTSGDGTHGGFVAVVYGSCTITGSVFNGKLLTTGETATGNCAGFIAWGNGTISNCLYAPANIDTEHGETEVLTGDVNNYPSGTFYRGTAPSVSNCYYTRTLGTAQGKATRTVTAGTDVTISAIALTGDATEYNVSGITAYSGGGLQRGENLYYGSGDAVSLTLSNTATGAPAGYQYAGYTASAGTLDDNNILTMPDEDVTVSLALAVLPWTGDGSKGSPYIIYNKDQLDLLAYRVNGTHGETRQTDGYSGKYFKLNNDISYTHTSDWDDFDSDESNYEAIGGYYDDDDRYFRGHFNGNNKTISGIRIYKDGNGGADYYQGIFGRTASGADIHDLTLADARITGYDFTGGIVGYNYGTVTRCHVTADVAVCAEQSDVYDHGGIVGYNNGTIEQCTSAATLTIVDATKSMYYGGIAGLNNYGILRDNLAIGATVPAAADNSYGAITGRNIGTLQRNYYAACKVANVENATGVGCGYIDDGNGGYITADVTADNGAVSINTLALTARVAPDGNYWTTYYNSALGFTIDAEENACAYTATYSGSQLTLHKLGKEIPKNTAVIIVADNDVVSMAAATDLDDFSGTNDLRGVDVDTPVADITSALGTGTFYVLGMTTVNKEQHFGFHRYTGTEMAAHKAFVLVSNGQALARSLTMVFDEATGISDATRLNNKEEIKNNNWFTLDGRRLQAKPTAPGIYVNNGRKVVIK